MFEIDKGDSYEWDVEIQEPTSEGHKTETFTALFNRISQPRIDELNEKVRQRMIAARAGEPVDGMIDDIQIADEVLVGWTAGMLKNGAPVEYTPALKKKLLARSAFAAAIVRAWNDAIGYGRKKTS